MRAIFASAKNGLQKRIVYAEGEDDRVLRSAQIIVDERLARPVLVGRPAVIEAQLAEIGLRIRPGVDIDVVDPESDAYFEESWQAYRKLMVRRGVTPDIARLELRRNNTLIGAMLVRLGYADGLICGVRGQYEQHLAIVADVIGKRPGVNSFAAMNYLMLPGRSLFICDTQVNRDPSAEEIAEMTLLAAEVVKRFGIAPKAALLSHSNFGSSSSPSAQKMRRAAVLLALMTQGKLEVDGEMQGAAALDEDVRRRQYPESTLKGEANLLVMPNIDAANISYSLLKMTGGEGVTIGPILLGAARPVHVLTDTASVRRLINMTAIAVVDAQQK
jgi:malate dehydrogenase (oxaloacetate-decarboxylating)(NADP+)